MFSSLILWLVLFLTILSSPSNATFFRDLILTSKDGIWTDSRAFSSLSDAISAIGSEERDLYIAKEETITSLTIPSNIRLHFKRKGSISNSGTLTINTRHIHADHQIFTGTGAVNFSPGTEVKSTWFADLETAISQTSNDSCVLLISAPATIANSIAVGPNVILKWNYPHLITVLDGRTLSGISEIIAPRGQLFASTGSVVASSSLRSDTLVEWFDNTHSTTGLTRAIAFISTSDRALIFSPATWSILTDITIPSNILPVFEKGAYLSISNGVTLTMPQPIADDQRIFTTVGTGKVVFSSPSTIYPEWFGAKRNGTNDDSAAFQSAIDSLSSGGTLKLRQGDYLISSSLSIPRGVSIVGESLSEVFKTLVPRSRIIYTGSGTLFLGTATWDTQRFTDFSVWIDTNTNSSLAVMDANYGTNFSTFAFSIYKGNNTVPGTIIKLRGKTAEGTANAALFFNTISIRIHGNAIYRSTGPAIEIGTDEYNCRANANYFFQTYISGYNEGIRIAGHDNYFLQCNFQQLDGPGIHFLIAAGGGGTHSNVIQGCYFDAYSSPSYPRIKVTNSLASDIKVFTLLGESIGVSSIHPLPIETINNGTGRATYNNFSHGVMLGGVVDSSYLRTYQSPDIYNFFSDGFLVLRGGPVPSAASDSGGTIAVCGKDVTSTADSTGPGNIVATLNSNLSDTYFRIAATSDYVNFTKLLEISPSGSIRGLRTSNGPVGSFSLTNGSSTTFVPNASVTANSKIFLQPTGSHAAAYITGVYISGRTDGVGFTVTHPVSVYTSATFDYLILN